MLTCNGNYLYGERYSAKKSTLLHMLNMNQHVLILKRCIQYFLYYVETKQYPLWL